MLIGELARKAGVTKECIRHYESLGLIRSAARQAGSREYRDYDDESMERLALIAKGKVLGFTLREGKPFLDLFMSGDLSVESTKALIAEKINDVDQRINRLQQVKEALIEKMSTLNQQAEDRGIDPQSKESLDI